MKKVITVIWWILSVLLLIGGIAGVLYELLPDKSVIPESVFETVFYTQFAIIALFIVSSLLKRKLKK